MSPRPTGERRVLGLWTAGCLAAVLALGVTRLGDWSVQWPVLLVPLLWATVAVRPRRDAPRRRDQDGGGHGGAPPSRGDAPNTWLEDEDPYRPRRTDTVEAPWVRDGRRRPPG